MSETVKQEPSLHFFTPAVALMRLRVELHPERRSQGVDPYSIIQQPVVGLVYSGPRQTAKGQRHPAFFGALYIDRGKIRTQKFESESADISEIQHEYGEFPGPSYLYCERVVYADQVVTELVAHRAKLWEIMVVDDEAEGIEGVDDIGDLVGGETNQDDLDDLLGDDPNSDPPKDPNTVS